MKSKSSLLSDYSFLFWSFNCVMVLIRMSLAQSVGLGVDEAHYALMGRALDLSYFDHPPLVGWVQFLFQLGGSADVNAIRGAMLARFPAIVCCFLTNIFFFRFLCRHSFKEREAFWGVVALNMTPLYNACSFMFLPDCLLNPLIFLIFEGVDQIEKNANQKKINYWGWTFLGLGLGLSGLAKYNAIIYIPALIFYFWTTPILKKIVWSKGLLIAVTISAVLISPVIVWNFKHDFSSFRYQSGHIFRWSEIHPLQALTSEGLQIAVWGIVPGLLAWWGVLSPRCKVPRVVRIFALFLGGFFVVISLTQILLPHWQLTFFTLMIPFAVASLMKEKRLLTWLRMGIGVSGVLTFFLFSELLFHFLPASATSIAYRDIWQWDEVVREGYKFLDRIETPNKALAVTNWSFMSRTLYYNPRRVLVFNLQDRHDQFEIWNPVSPEGMDLIVIGEQEHESELKQVSNCQKMERVGELKTLMKQIVIRHMVYYHCTNFSKKAEHL